MAKAALRGKAIAFATDSTLWTGASAGSKAVGRGPSSTRPSALPREAGGRCLLTGPAQRSQLRPGPPLRALRFIACRLSFLKLFTSVLVTKRPQGVESAESERRVCDESWDQRPKGFSSLGCLFHSQGNMFSPQPSTPSPADLPPLQWPELPTTSP